MHALKWRQCVGRDLALCQRGSGQWKGEMSTWGISERKSLMTNS